MKLAVALLLVLVAGAHADCNSGDRRECRQKYVNMLNGCAASTLYLGSGSAFVPVIDSGNAQDALDNNGNDYIDPRLPYQPNYKIPGVTRATGCSVGTSCDSEVHLSSSNFMSVRGDLGHDRSASDLSMFNRAWKGDWGNMINTIGDTFANDETFGGDWNEDDCPNNCQDKLNDWISKCRCLNDFHKKEYLAARVGWTLNLHCNSPGYLPGWAWFLLFVFFLCCIAACIGGTFAAQNRRAAM